MKKTIVFNIFIFLTIFAFSQRQPYSSTVYDGAAFLPIANANIYNSTSGEHVFSDKKGYFTIKVFPGDIIIISKSQYRQFVFVISKENTFFLKVDYYLYRKPILLKEVRVIALNSNYEYFKKELVEMKLPEIYSKMDGINITEQDKVNSEYANKGSNILRNTAVSSPITYLYDSFSKKSKMKRLYNEIIQYEEEIDKIPAKYSRELVKEITGLKEEELMNFMVFCRFSYYDILKWTPQEIISAIKSKFSEYSYYKALEDE